MSLFNLRDYRKILKNSLEEKRFLDKAYTYQAMAEYIGIQKTYLSKVINNRADLNSDQLYLACLFLEFSNEEIEYLHLLLEHERSVHKQRKDYLLDQIKEIQEQKSDAREVLGNEIKSLSAKEFDQSDYAEYYLNPVVMIVHMFLIIPRFKKNPDLIADELNVAPGTVQYALTTLQALKIIEVRQGKVEVLLKTLHLPRESKLVPPHHQLLHSFGVQRKNSLPVNKKKAFTVTFCSDENARKKIEEEFNSFIGRVREISKKGSKKGCYQLNFDLFPWSNS